ncbi:MAG: tetratricopeptide repeat protein [Verrucomicrobia subdivision 3 bacterium]|nr:tetratricopeptide repeat protein [Limisphaerales bacterium]
MHFAGQCRFTRAANICFAVACAFLACSTAQSADLDEVRKDFRKGRYLECLKTAEKEVREQPYSEEWRTLVVECLMATGRYTNAATAVESALDRSFSSIKLRLMAREVFLANGMKDRAQAMLEEMEAMVTRRSRFAYRDAASLIAVGKMALLFGADPRRVLENFFDRAKAADPSSRDVYLAIGQLALDKGDYALAAKTFSEALKRFEDDADMYYGLARAYAPSDRREMVDAIETALTHNTNHVRSLILLAEHFIDGEEYETARKTLDRAFAVNPEHPLAWANVAVIAHLAGDAEDEDRARQRALAFWDTNPAVDHLIGQKLSQKYRFAEGAEHQKRALKFDPKHVEAKIQLAQDLLRLGEEEDGWKLCDEAHKDDAYDVTAYNLVTLKETLDGFATLTNEHFILRMSKHEAAIYGDEALALLENARQTLCEKYDVTLQRPTTVEIFPNQKDFGVRTFGMPHNPGFLGVCFGPVVTANSPASQGGEEANWQAVLWHEFCHVVTLQMTANKMPRWLSEGISVYEELQANPTWGQTINAKYREMILGKDLVAISELSSAFLAPRSDLHLQFAYYESSLVVQFLVERFGMAKLRAILKDLGEGTNVNVAIEAHTTRMADLEEEFGKYARKLARKFGPELDWQKNDDAEDEEIAPTNKENYYKLAESARTLIREKKWQEAKAPLKRWIEHVPNQTAPDNPYVLLAYAHRQLGETNEERSVLSQVAAIDADDAETFLRLMELAMPESDWADVRRNAERYLAVNPLVPAPYAYLAESAEELGDNERAVRAWRKLLLLDPPDPAQAYYRLGRLLHQAGDPTARRHVLKALEAAPRFREAQRLLLQMEREAQKDT